MMEQVLVRLPVDLVERLAPGRLAEVEAIADADPEFAQRRVGHYVAQALHEISVQAQERRQALLKLLDQVA